MSSLGRITHLTWQPLLTALPMYLLSSKSDFLGKWKEAFSKYIFQAGLDLKFCQHITASLFGLSILLSLNKALNMRNSGRGILSSKDRYDWSQELVVITGASSGIGNVVARRLGNDNVKTIILDINEPPSLIPNTFFYKLDVTSDVAIAEVATRIRKEHGNPTVLINNAGIGTPSFILETSMSYIRKVFEVNAISHYALVKQFLPNMLNTNHGHIVNIASMASFVTLGQNVPYSASKAAALSMIDGMRQEARNFYKADKVLFSSVHPHFVKTPMVEPFFDDMSDFLSPEQVAGAILDVLYSESSQQKIVPSMAGMWAGIQGYPAWLGTGFRSAMSLKYLKTSTEPRRVTVKAD